MTLRKTKYSHLHRMKLTPLPHPTVHLMCPYAKLIPERPIKFRLHLNFVGKSSFDVSLISNI